MSTPTQLRGRRRRLRRLLLVPLAAVIVVVLFFAASLIGALTTPGNQNFQAKWADWLRSHDAAFIANHLESYYYSHNAPSRGGVPRGLNPLPASADAASDPSHSPPTIVVRSHLAAPSPVPLVVSPALPGEGSWRPAGPDIGGVPSMYEAQFRADDVYTSQITSAVWIDTSLLRVALVPGAYEPGGTWAQTPYINSAQLPYALAAFNGGFRVQDARGGFYLNGTTEVPLRMGAASMVIYSDGHIDIGTWGNEVSMSQNVVAVLQNLALMVDRGRLASNATYSDNRVWGSTLGANTVVARSGIGVSATGALIYVAGPALTAKSLAESLQRAGAVRAMTLDINPEWVTLNFYSHPNGVGSPLVYASKLYPSMQRPATRYLGPTRESRDFFMVYAP
ncbi:MAG TPA: phosphodiester glycosidase family protein [Acidimicrobiales bacterium]